MFNNPIFWVPLPFSFGRTFFLNLVTWHFYLVTRPFYLVTQVFYLVTRPGCLVARFLYLVTRPFSWVTRYDMYIWWPDPAFFIWRLSIFTWWPVFFSWWPALSIWWPGLFIRWAGQFLYLIIWLTRHLFSNFDFWRATTNRPSESVKPVLQTT